MLIFRWEGKLDSSDSKDDEMGERKERDHNNNEYSLDKEYYGIELDISDSAANNGNHGSNKYFNCAPNRGIFSVSSEIIENLGSTTKQWNINRYNISLREKSLKENDRVQVAIGGSGIIRYLGNPGFVDDLMYGIELDQWSPNASNGFVHGQEFFQCEQGKGFFVFKDSILQFLSVDDPDLIRREDMDLPQLTKMPRMHDRIKLVDGQIGVVCFIGMLEFSSETYIGCKLDQWSPNGNDGSAAGKKYFKCAPGINDMYIYFIKLSTQLRQESYYIGYGYFVKIYDIAANLGSIRSVPFRTKEQNLFKIGDKVKLLDGNIGIIKYIGFTHFGKEELIGIELDNWSPNGHNGKIKGRTYFRAAPGCGTFVRRNSIISRVDNLGFDIDNNNNNNHNSLLLPNCGDRVKLKNGKMGVVQWIEDDSSIIDNLKTIHIQLVKEEERKVNDTEEMTIQLSDIFQNLGRQANTMVHDKDIIIGAHVRIIHCKTGFIRYIGPIGNIDELIGIELDSWTHNGHDGKGHFKCPIGT